jgi:hypothetical protein
MVWGLDMRFLGRKWQKKKADPCGMTTKKGNGKGEARRWPDERSG